MDTTLLLVDVDGVLNVGTQDWQGGGALLLNDENMKIAEMLLPVRDSHQEGPNIERICLTAKHTPNGETATLATLAAKAPSHISELLLARLAEIIEAAGESCFVVLSSTWQRPCNRANLQALEQSLSKHLGRNFTFDAATGSREDSTPRARLEAIGGYVQRFCADRASNRKGGAVRLLVLEDFFITPLNGWHCGFRRMDSCSAVEKYLESRASASTKVTAKLLHTFEEWTTTDGKHLRAGIGITQEHLRQAKEFLAEAKIPQPVAERISSIPSPSNLFRAATTRWTRQEIPERTETYCSPTAVDSMDALIHSCVSGEHAWPHFVAAP